MRHQHGIWNHPVTELRPGDIWESNCGEEQVRIDAVDIRDDDVCAGWVRITGQIIKGYGRRTKGSWSFPPEQTIDILRP